MARKVKNKRAVRAYARACVAPEWLVSLAVYRVFRV
jgi:hypothetical protein